MNTDESIRRQVAFKGAVEAVMRSQVAFKSLEEIAVFVEAATDRFEAILNKETPEPATYESHPATGPECPTHHKSKEGKYGLFCPSKLADDSWCQWKP